MMIRKINYEEFTGAVRSALAARDKQKSHEKEGEKALKKLWALLPETQEDRCGLRIMVAEEDEVEDLLLPLLRGMQVPMAAVIVVSRDVPLGLLDCLPGIRQNTAFSLVIPLERERENVTLHLMPVAARLRERFTIDGLMASLFPRGRTKADDFDIRRV